MLPNRIPILCYLLNKDHLFRLVIRLTYSNFLTVVNYIKRPKGSIDRNIVNLIDFNFTGQHGISGFIAQSFPLYFSHIQLD